MTTAVKAITLRRPGLQEPPTVPLQHDRGTIFWPDRELAHAVGVAAQFQLRCAIEPGT